MQIYGPFRVSAAQATGTPKRIQPQKSAQPATQTKSAVPVDQLDLSSSATSINRLDSTSPVAGGGEIRIDKVADIRRQIADGKYDTPEKMDKALDSFLDQYI